MIAVYTVDKFNRGGDVLSASRDPADIATRKKHFPSFKGQGLQVDGR